MYLLTAEEARTIDNAAIKELGIPGVVLMENAGLQVAEIIYKIIGDPKGKKIAVLAGKGNNGGDGFVVARHLINAGAEVKVLMFADIMEITGDAKINLNILQSMGHKIYPISNPNSINIVKLTLLYSDLIVDAVYGTGFKGEVPGHVGNIIELINASEKPVVSVDIPSGLEASTGKVNGLCVKASHTVTFGHAKLGLLVHDGPHYTGELTVADISIPSSLVKNINVKRYLTTPDIIRSFIPLRRNESHKGSYGKVLVIGGSEGMTGAVTLAGNAALRAGAGLTTIAVPKSLHSIMEIKTTEAMTVPLPETDKISVSIEALSPALELINHSDVVALGPGMSTHQETQEFIRKLVNELNKPVVIDADALNALAGNTDILVNASAQIVLTPHPGEMARLLGIKIEEVQNNRVDAAFEAAKRWKTVVVLKGNRTIIASPDGSLYVNPTGNPGMASGGMGDVLTGIVAGLLAQGMSPTEAAVTGVYLHGAAGDLGAKEKGMISLTAGDVLEYMPQAAREFSKKI